MNEARKGMIEFWAGEKPSAAAVVDAGRTFTWKELNDLANGLAYGLKRRGIIAGDTIILRMQNRAEWVVANSALGKLGCRLLAVNWRLTAEELKYVLSNSEAVAIICDDADPVSIAPAFAERPLKCTVSIEANAPGFISFAALAAEPVKEPLYAESNPPLILYTSGTTGLPKGVVMGQPFRTDEKSIQEAHEYQRSVAEAAPQMQGDVVLITMPLHHGAGAGLAWTSISRGNMMVMLRRFDPEETLKLIDRYRVSVWTGVPTMFKRIAGLPEETLSRYDVSSMRTLMIGAAPVPFSLKEWIISYFGNCLYESYGATECGMMTWLSPQMQLAKPGSSGLPYKHVCLTIRNELGQELPPRSVGEIWVKTPVVMKQYLNGKKLDGDTLDANGFYRTGDVGYLDEAGYLFITDRAKDMIVSGGVNIYPAEIEAALLKHPAVQDAAVIGIPDEEFGEQVKAFCELKPGRQSDEATLKAHVKPLLASYKWPKSIEFMDELPRNTTGKLLKRELRAPYWVGKERNV